jgi:hypothetical protein
LTVAGCGDDNSDGEEAAPATEGTATTTEEAPAAPTKQEYIAEADKTCSQAAEKQGSKLISQLNKTGEAFSSATTTDAQSAVASDIVDALNAVADYRADVSKELEALEPPESGPPDTYLRSRERNTESVRDQAKAFQAFADSPTQETLDVASQAASKSKSLGQQDLKLAEDYGFEVCGQPIK